GLAAGGFRDITRIASSNPKMWQDIFLHNKTKLSRLLQDWINEMVTLKEFLDMNKEAEMVHYLNEAKDYRDGLNAYSRGALPSYHDLYVDVKDKPGAIASVVQSLADADISIRNIRILEIRDNINGALRLSVTSKEDQQKAYELLQAQDYDVTMEIYRGGRQLEKKLKPIAHPLHGELIIPGDKSISHRAIILGSIAEGRTKINNFLSGEDCLRTIDIFRSFGVQIEQNDTDVVIQSQGVTAFTEPKEPLYFGNSGTTARLMIGLLAGLPFHTVV